MDNGFKRGHKTMRKESLGKWLARICRQNQKTISKKLRPYQIGGGGQHSFLMEIFRRPGINQDELTNDLKFDKATTARSVKQLELDGYIKREVDEKDRRSYRLFPTEKGLDFQPVLQSILNDTNKVLTKGLSSAEQDQLLLLLKKVYENSQKDE